MGDADTLDDVRETGAVRAPALTAAQTARGWQALYDAAEQVARSAQMRAASAQREADALHAAARDLVDELDAHIRPVVGRVTAEDLATVRAAADRLRALL